MSAPSPPWTLRCPWCTYHLIVHARGARGNDRGAGVEAAELMRAHVAAAHDKTWPEYLDAEKLS